MTRGFDCSTGYGLLKSENDLRRMAKCVLNGLKRLHAGGFVHRDIRLPNILYLPHESQFEYVLIDFENGGKIGKKFTESDYLKEWTRETLSRTKCYDSNSDVFQLGVLLGKHRVLKSAMGREFVKKLKEKKLSAAQALEEPWLKHEQVKVEFVN